MGKVVMVGNKSAIDVLASEIAGITGTSFSRVHANVNTEKHN